MNSPKTPYTPVTKGQHIDRQCVMGGRTPATFLALLPPKIRLRENIFCEGEFLKREGEEFL